MFMSRYDRNREESKLKKLLLIFLFIMFASCSFKVSDDGGINGLNPGLSNGDGIPIQEDSQHSYNIGEVFGISSFFQRYEVTSVYSKEFETSLSDGNQTLNIEPFPHFVGKETVNIYLKDKTSNALLVGDVNFNVYGKYDAPTTFIDHVRYEGQSSITIDVLANDIDVDGDLLTIVSVDSVDDASITIENSKIVFTPDQSFDLPVNSSIDFNYLISDSTGLTASGIVTLFNSVTALQESSEGLIPLKLVFLKSTDVSLSSDIEADADEALRVLNSKLKIGDQSFNGFYKLTVEEIEDNELYTMCDPTSSNCIDYDKLISRYNQKGAVTLVFVNSILGPVAGIARVNRLPFSSQATVVSEYRGLKRGNTYEENGTIYTHEIGHLLGLEHTQQVGEAENAWINYLNCGLVLTYFQRGGSYEIEPHNENGVLWNDYNNTMKSVISSQRIDKGFFTSGYDQVFNKVFSCYRARSLQ